MALKSVHYTSTKYRDSLIRVSLLCQETEICSFVNTMDDMTMLFANPTPEV